MVMSTEPMPVAMVVTVTVTVAVVVVVVVTVHRDGAMRLFVIYVFVIMMLNVVSRLIVDYREENLPWQ